VQGVNDAYLFYRKGEQGGRGKLDDHRKNRQMELGIWKKDGRR